MPTFTLHTRKFQELVPDKDNRQRLSELARLTQRTREMRLPGPRRVKEITLSCIEQCRSGVTVSELLSVEEFGVLLHEDNEGVGMRAHTCTKDPRKLVYPRDAPSRRSLSMRLLRYQRQGYLKRHRVGREYRYYATEKALFYTPRSLSEKVKEVFERLKKDPRYDLVLTPNYGLLAGRARVDKELGELLTEHAEALEK